MCKLETVHLWRLVVGDGDTTHRLLGIQSMMHGADIRIAFPLDWRLGWGYVQATGVYAVYMQ